MTRSVECRRVVQVAAAFFTVVLLAGVSACVQSGEWVEIDGDDIGGVVSGPDGPEAGVWVIAETMDLPTRFNRIVVTDDQGRYLIPDLPDATYDVWVRGYGLVDSRKVQATPGSAQDLTAVVAPDPHAAAQYYPAAYWFSLIEVPGKSEFPGTGAQGNGISPSIGSQSAWVRSLKSGGCMACHQLGNKATREIPAAFGEFATTADAWDRRIQSGQAGGSMVGGLNRLGRPRALEMFADWTDRIAAGEVPPAPPRPQGEERNVVITQWDWADPTAYLHDQASTDKRDPTVNAYGPVYGALEASADYVPVLDPMTHTASQVPLPVRDPNTPVASGPPLQPSPYWGDEAIWDSRANAHNPMLDDQARVWLTSRVGPGANPAFCREGSDHPSARLFPTQRAGRHLAMYDPATEKVSLIRTCFSTHHLIFAEDENNTLWTSGGGQVIGWLNTKMYLETGDEEASQGWSALILDTNGNGRQDEYVEPNEPVDPTKDKRISSGYYGVAANPMDGTIWGSSLGFPRRDSQARPGPQPARDGSDGGLRAALGQPGRTRAGILPAWHGHRPQRRRLDAPRERTHGQLRPQQVHGAAQRTHRHRRPLPGGLDPLPGAGATNQEPDRVRQCRVELLHVGGSVQHVGVG